MAETAVAVTAGPVINVDLAKLDKKQLKYLQSMRDRDAVLQVTGQVADVGKAAVAKVGDLAIALAGTEIAPYILMFLIVHGLWKVKFLDDAAYIALESALAAAGTWDVITPW